jgi:hypothetical protein
MVGDDVGHAVRTLGDVENLPGLRVPVRTVAQEGRFGRRQLPDQANPLAARSLFAGDQVRNLQEITLTSRNFTPYPQTILEYISK